ncbi:DsrE family protein [Halalkalicoccus subterraneus]|uniref:DsrE family protein n=1 Tax=Halalkalicoccus subterraneus TaxID=2675002 RepID=UPI0013CECDC8|nr:DsrE family protein [Halalkalicoccus subterraneus]
MDVALHCSAESPAERAHAIANVGNLLDARADASVVFVANGDGVLALTADAEQADRVGALADRGVAFRACANSLRSRGIDETSLAEGVETVPAGVGELVGLQAAGSSYIKVP